MKDLKIILRKNRQTLAGVCFFCFYMIGNQVRISLIESTID